MWEALQQMALLSQLSPQKPKHSWHLNLIPWLCCEPESNRPRGQLDRWPAPLFCLWTQTWGISPTKKQALTTGGRESSRVAGRRSRVAGWLAFLAVKRASVPVWKQRPCRRRRLSWTLRLIKEHDRRTDAHASNLGVCILGNYSDGEVDPHPRTIFIPQFHMMVQNNFEFPKSCKN